MTATAVRLAWWRTIALGAAVVALAGWALAAVAWGRGDDARAALASAEWAVAQRDSVVRVARAELRRRDSVATVAQATTDDAIAAVRTAVRTAVRARRAGGSAPPAAAGAPLVSVCDDAPVEVALVALETRLAEERAAAAAAIALRDSIIDTEPGRVAALVAVAVAGEQRRREAAEADARAARRRAARARVETVLVGAVTFLLGRA